MSTKFKELRDLARAQAGAAIAVETHQSYPVPLRRGDKPLLAFLLAPSIVRPQEGLWLMPPNYVLEVEYPSGTFCELRAVVPAQFGSKDDPQKAIGKYDMVTPTRTSAEFLKMQARLYELYDLLAPEFLSGATQVPRERAREAAEFRELFPKITEAPLLPYYKALGEGFFAWLGERK